MTDPTAPDPLARPRTGAQFELARWRDRFTTSTNYGAKVVDLLRRSDVGTWRFEPDRNHPTRWWIHVTLPSAAAEMFDIHLEVLVLYTELGHLEPRTLEQVQSRLRHSARLERGVAVVISRDPKVGQLASRRRGELSIVAINLDELQTDSRDVRSRMAAVMSTIDHYDLTNPVRDPSGFFGRASESDFLRESLDRGQSVGIFGLRKAGKTSLMNAIQEQRSESGALITKVDVSEVTTADEFRLKLLTRTWEAVRARLGPHERMPRLRLVNTDGKARVDGPNIATHWTDDLRMLLDAAGVRLELFVDEIDQAYPDRSTLDHVEASALFQTLTQLRGLVQEGTRLVLLCAGVDPALFERPLFGDRDNLLYKLVRLLWLSPMSRDEMAEMVRGLGKRMAVRARDYRVIDRLYEEYGGHPLLTRKACSLAIKGRKPDELPFELSFERLETAISSSGFDSPHAQALDVLRSFEKWFPGEAELLAWLYSADETERELARAETTENPDRLMHAVAYGLCDESYRPRIAAALSRLG